VLLILNVILSITQIALEINIFIPVVLLDPQKVTT